MMRLTARTLLVPLALVLMLAARPVAGQSTPPPPSPPAGQTPATPAAAKPETPPATPQPPPTPPDRAAYLAASKIADNDKKIEALEKWLKDFPDSSGAATTHALIFDTLIKHRPTDRAAILNAGQRYIDNAVESAPEGSRHTAYTRIANGLVTANLYLDEAVKIAEKGLQSFEDEMTKRAARDRATHLATIGRLHLKQGRTAEADKALKAAYAANPELASAAIGLAELSEARNDTKGALEYWMTAALGGRLTKEDQERFEKLYRTTNNGTIDGLDAALDAKYKKAFTAPVHPEPYKASAARTDKLVLAEVFTGAGCPPCVAADLAFDAAMERYSKRDLAVVMYHMHIPVPDPLTNAATIERAKYYRINSVPSFAIDGTTSGGGGGRDATKGVYSRITSSLDKALEDASGAAINLEAAMVGGAVKVKATPSKLGEEGEGLKLQILLVEEMLSYSGENGVRFHPMVVRSIAGNNYGGIAVDRKAAGAVDHVFDLAQITADNQKYLDEYEETRSTTQPGFAFSRKPAAMNTGNLSVVAFLQEEGSKKILQAAYLSLGGASTSAASR